MRVAGKGDRIAGALALATALLWPANASATETDQFLAWTAEIADSRDVLNTYVNERLEALLEHTRRRSVSCERLTKRFFRHLFPSMSHPRIREDLARDFAIERYPGPEVGYWSHLRSSVYRKPAFPFMLPMARTWNIGGVRTGGDKLGHMLGHGRHYYGRYLRMRREGSTMEEALAETVRWGVLLESKIVGGMVDGVFSHADLEANFQGLRLAISFCEGDGPLLRREGGAWIQTRPLDFASFVNPGFDESWNNSYYAGFRWKRVQPIVAREYCPLLRNDVVRERRELYREIDRPSFSRLLIEREFENLGRFRRAPQSIEAVCARASTAE